MAVTCSKLRFLFLAMILAGAAGCTAEKQPDILSREERAWLAAHPVIRIAPDPNFPPIESFDEKGRYVGFAADVFRLMEQRLQVRFQIVRLKTWEEVVRAAQDRRIDGITAAQPTPDRRAFLNFSPPLVDIPNVIIVPKDKPGRFEFSRMKGLRIVVTAGNALHEHIRRAFPELRVFPAADDLSCLLDVSFGRADATVVNLAIASHLIERYGITNLRLAGDSGRTNQLAVATRNDWPVLARIMAKGLAAVTEAEREAAYRKWVRLEQDPLLFSKAAWRLVGWGILGIVLLGVLGVMWNITLARKVAKRTAELGRELEARRLAEEDLLRQKEHLAVTLRSIGDGVVVTDTAGRVTMLNSVAEAMTGWSSERAKGRPLGEVMVLFDSETRAPIAQPIEDLFRRGSFTDLKGRGLLVSRDGSERAISDSLAPIRDPKGVITGAVLIIRDVTEKEAVERELRNLHKLESLGVLAGGLAHDFNNIMTAILGNITLARLEPDDLPSLRDRHLAGAEAAVERARGLTQQLLTFSKGGAPIKKAMFLSTLLRENAQFVLAGSNVNCAFEIPDDLPPVDIDEAQISQVVCNLVINAKQAMPRGGKVTLRAAVREIPRVPGAHPPTPGQYVAVTVVDQGTGIPENLLSRIFDPFFSTKEKGHGLGLSSSRSIVERHGGVLTVESALGKGTEFTFLLPVSLAVPEVSPGPVAQPVATQGRVLVMDDEESVRQVVQGLLDRLGYACTGVGDGEAAVAAYRQARETGTPYDLVLMDLTVPGGMGGKEAFQAIAADDPGVKAIVTSGYSSDPILADPRSFGFLGALVKPFRIEELSEAVSSVLHGPGAGRLQ